MFKSKLQELCQKQKWALPTYTVTRGDGPDHSPRFLASVTLNGITFDAADLAFSSKEAQNKVAQMAFDHFAPTVPPPSPPAVSQLTYKSQLQIYSQKHLIDLPTYTTVRQGPAHALLFRAQVVVDGKTFNGALSFKTLKEAENDVAKTALMFLQSEENNTTEDNMVSYKTLLLEWTQKERLGAPNYKTGSNGTPHMPLFSSIVEIGDDSFSGEFAKTKKQAETNAAKVAWLNLKERCRASPSVQDNLFTAASFSQSKVSNTREISHFTSNQTGTALEDNRDNEITTENVSSSTLMLSNLKIHQDTTADAISDVVSAFPVNYANSTLLSNRVRVYPRAPDLVLSKYETELPFSNDEWVAVSVDDPIYEGDVFRQGNGNTFDKSSHEISLNRSSEVIEISFPPAINSSSSSSESSVADNEISGGMGSNSPGRDGRDGKYSLLCNRIAVHPNNSDAVLPEGVFKLPFSDDKWVALSYDI